jgi:hypothetical protein
LGGFLNTFIVKLRIFRNVAVVFINPIAAEAFWLYKITVEVIECNHFWSCAVLNRFDTQKPTRTRKKSTYKRVKMTCLRVKFTHKRVDF